MFCFAVVLIGGKGNIYKQDLMLVQNMPQNLRLKPRIEALVFLW